MDRQQSRTWTRREIRVTDRCVGCGYCVKHFECPAMHLREEKEPVEIDRVMCSGCGVCLAVCPHGALAVAGESET
jgi:indolepyruvate ferredoxin oxidoreductase alpha subunit